MSRSLKPALLRYVSVCWLLLVLHFGPVDASTSPQVPFAVAEPVGSPRLTLSDDWQVLGPFQIGTREAAWGADPLEAFGGFRALQYNPDAEFKSSLAPWGLVKWTQRRILPESFERTAARVKLGLTFPDVDWDTLKLAFGWSASQFQAWARTYIQVETEGTTAFEVYTDRIIEFWIDGHAYFGGDFFSYRRSPAVVHLGPGSHRVDIRCIRDVRSMGGVGEPFYEGTLEFRAVGGDLVVDHGKTVAPDVVNGRLASKLASIALRNAATAPILVTELKSKSRPVAAKEPLPIEIAPGQTRPVVFELDMPFTGSITNLSMEIDYKIGSHQQSTFALELTLMEAPQLGPHRYTYLHPAGIVSYALMRPPAPSSANRSDTKVPPVLLFLHGAEEEADSLRNSQMLDGASDLQAWTIFASGVTSWSGDDWHQWGWPDVEAAVAAIPTWIKNNHWNGPGVDLDHWIVTGHSNGGQGAWFALTHKLDKVVAATPVSGYSSVPNYIPFTLWRSTDPRRMAVVHASMNSYRHELLVTNAKEIPIAQQHGVIDRNVPCFHARFLRQLLNETGWNSQYNELPNTRHYFDGVMTTEPLLRFYATSVESSDKPLNRPDQFSLVVANPADTGAKFGVKIEQLMDPGQLGRIETRLTFDEAAVTTSNVHSIHFDSTWLGFRKMILDQQDVAAQLRSNKDSMSLVRNCEGTWELVQPSKPLSLAQRRGDQLGNLDAILRSKGPFVIESHDEATKSLAVQVSRNMFQYYAADSKIVCGDPGSKLRYKERGNLITLGVGANITHGEFLSHPIRISSSSVHLRTNSGAETEFKAGVHGLGAIFLRPLPDERLEVVVWGSDKTSADAAARLLPLISGPGQPDFIILTREILLRGVDGALAMGFLDSSWNVSKSSFVL